MKKELKIQIDQNQLKQYKDMIMKKEIDLERTEGYVSTFGYVFESIPFDVNSKMSIFPYNFADIKLRIEFEPQTILVKYINTKTKKEECRLIEFAYCIKDSIVPQNVLSVNFNDCDQLENYDTFNN